MIKNSLEMKVIKQAKTKIKGAWYFEGAPNKIIFETVEENLILADDTWGNPPQHQSGYKGYHPNRTQQREVPEYLWKFYGFEKG